MGKYLTFFLSLLSVNVSAQTDVDIDRVFEAGLPVVMVETEDGVSPTYDYAVTPPGCVGNAITNATKVPGRVLVLGAGRDTLFDSGSYVAKKSGMTIKIRGNSSASGARDAKKAYKIKLQAKADMLSTDDGADHSDKNWLLLKMDDESPMLNFVTGMSVNRCVGLQYTPCYEPVNVMLNGEYMGVYFLSESVCRNADVRIDVDKNAGYIFEYDPYWWNEERYVESRFKFNYTLKYPDDELTELQLSYFTSLVNRMDDAIIDYGYYADIIDVESFAEWMLGHDILGTKDSGGSNIFLTKYDSSDTTRVMMANMWDFDTIEKMRGNWANSHNGLFFLYLFNRKAKSDFVKAYKRKWDEVSETLFDDVSNSLTAFVESDTGEALERSLVLDGLRWGMDRQTLRESLDSALEWLTYRKDWLALRIPRIHERYFLNNPLPEGQHSLKVLAIGDSDMSDDTAYLPKVLDGMGVPADSYCVYSVCHEGASLSYWAETLGKGVTDSLRLVAGECVVCEDVTSERDFLEHDWDVVVLQQSYEKSCDYSSFNPYLRTVIDEIRKRCLNDKVTIAWQMTHSHMMSDSLSATSATDSVWQVMCDVTMQMIEEDGVDVVIPVGTAVQDARNTPFLQTEHELTRDGARLSYGVGRYLATCVWAQSLFAPVYGFDVCDCVVCHDVLSTESGDDVMYEDSCVPVDETNREICLMAVTYACLTPFKLTQVAPILIR